MMHPSDEKLRHYDEIAKKGYYMPEGDDDEEFFKEMDKDLDLEYIQQLVQQSYSNRKPPIEVNGVKSMQP